MEALSHVISPVYYLHTCTAALSFVSSTVVFNPVAQYNHLGNFGKNTVPGLSRLAPPASQAVGPGY